MNETELQHQILKALEQSGYWAFRVNTGRSRGSSGRIVQGAPAGTPDICVVNPPGWLECKIPGGKLRPEQEAWHARARRLGVRVDTVCAVGEALTVVGGWTRQDATRDGVAFELRRIVEAL